MKRALFAVFFLFTFLIAQADDASLIRINTRNTELILKVGQNNQLYQCYYGTLINLGMVSDEDASLFKTKYLAYSTYGTSNVAESAIRLMHNDGNPSTSLQFKSKTVEKKGDNITETLIMLKDPVYPVEVTLHFKAYFNENVIETFTDIRHAEKKPLVLYNYASAMLHFDANHYWLTHFHGEWAQEVQMQEEKLTYGTKVIDTKTGIRTDFLQSPFFYLSLNKKSDENNGHVVAATIAWPGNFRLAFEVDQFGWLGISAGINPYASEYTLAPNTVFTTPSFIYTYSDKGKGSASRNFHDWARNYGLKDGHKSRLTLLNNWETTYFNFDQKRLNELFEDAKTLGVDMFLLDDGWFGNKYPRSSDRSGLGDWQATKTKLPDGIGYLIQQGTRTGVKFGIWIEPEMVNPKSELYEQHPDWVLKLPNRPEDYVRNQLVLDLCNPKVQDFVFKVVDDIMQTGKGVDYFKWDCNRWLRSAYSVYLKEKQSHLFVEYTRGLLKVLDRIKTKYPDLPMMMCSGGGGRVNYGLLPYFTEFWASDNTDPYNRIFIQWNYSNFYPSMAVCNHVTSWGNQSIKFRTDVAMMGKLGFDINVPELKSDELKFCKEAVTNYKRLSPVIYQGDLYRLISPYEDSRAMLMYVDKAKFKSVVFSYTLHPLYDSHYEAVCLQGLDPDKMYKVEEINLMPGSKSRFDFSGKIFSGDFLMKRGLELSNSQEESSVILELTAS